jgi:hypothetical protein
MGRPIGPRKIHHYSDEFKLTAVKLSGLPGMQAPLVAGSSWVASRCCHATQTGLSFGGRPVRCTGR